MLPNYFLHILQHPNTLLTRLYGLHKISTEKIRNTCFVVMENIFMDYEIDETYDLKGSTIGRKADGTSAIKKDLDLNRRILLGTERRNILLHQIEIDCKFLEKNNIMDYSFLLGIRFISSTPEPNNRPFASIFQKERGGYQSTTEGNEFHGIVYYFGIIDIFTTYNIKKQLEHTYKSTVYETKDEISVVDAVKYADRFKKFIGKITGWRLTEQYG
jgi:1-phosphatidylinositol-4-phosphate 5-kinase